MPELPEVELGRKVAARAAAGRVVESCWVDRSDEIVFDGVKPNAVKKALVGATVVAVHRRGKQLWFELDRRPWPLFHFGMTGAFVVPGEAPLLLESSAKKRDTSWPPRFTKIHMCFEGGGELVMINKRRLGRIRLREDPENEAPIKDLGFDPYLELPDLLEFRELLSRRKVTLKALLLNQTFAAGVGNWIADEVLYQAKLDPRRRVQSLTDKEQATLRKKLGSVIERAVAVDADKTRFPKRWLFHHRWGKDDAAKTAKGEPIEFLTLAGRTTAWVPTVQR